MKKFKMGTPETGILLGCCLAGAGALVLLIGFWKALILVALFGIGYFAGTVDNKAAFIRDKANRIIPEKKEPKAIDIRSEVLQEQKQKEKALEADEE